MNTDQHDNRRLLWVRAGWWSIILIGLGTFIASLPPYITALQTVCEGCSAPYLTPGNLQELQALGLSTGFWVAHNLIYVLVPMLIYLIHHDNQPSIRVAQQIGMTFEKEGNDEKGPYLLYSLER